VVEPGFLGETSYRQLTNLIVKFSTVGVVILGMVNVEDIIRNAPRL
jgi:hypothetical protein